jgi:hypothetical protein
MNYDLPRGAKIGLAIAALFILVMIGFGNRSPLDPDPNVASCMQGWISESAGRVTNEHARDLCKRYPKISAKELKR